MVLCAETTVAGESLFRLSPLAAGHAFARAMVISDQCYCGRAGALAGPLTIRPWPCHSGPLLCRHAFSFARVHQWVLHAVLLCVRSLGLPFEPGVDHASCRTARACRIQGGDTSITSSCCRGSVTHPGRANLAAKPYVSRYGDSLASHLGKKPEGDHGSH